MIDDVYKALRELQKIQKQIGRIQAGDSEESDRVRMVANGRVFNILENRTWWSNALREAKIPGKTKAWPKAWHQDTWLR
jgi:hypothetical protein